MDKLVIYNETKNEILVDVTGVGSEYIGYYKLAFWVSYFNSTYEYMDETEFTLAINGKKEVAMNDKGKDESGGEEE